MDQRLPVFLLGLVAGAVIAGGVFYLTATPDTGVSVPSMSSNTATGCADSNDSQPWVGQTAALEYRHIEFQNYSFTHNETNIEVQSTLSEQSDGQWQLAFTTQPDSPSKNTDSDCSSRTTLSASVALPSDFDRLAIQLDGETLTVVQNSQDRPQFRYLNATESAG